MTNSTLIEWLEARAEVLANLAGDDPNNEAVWTRVHGEAQEEAGRILLLIGLDVTGVHRRDDLVRVLNENTDGE